ncbi:hypothetical protein LX90_009131 [Lentzea flava]|nr:hypothetical protein [Lentzea flava]
MSPQLARFSFDVVANVTDRPITLRVQCGLIPISSYTVRLTDPYAAKVLWTRAIIVNALSPDATATDFAGGAIRNDDKSQATVTANCASGRVGKPEDIGWNP